MVAPSLQTVSLNRTLCLDITTDANGGEVGNYQDYPTVAEQTTINALLQ